MSTEELRKAVESFEGYMDAVLGEYPSGESAWQTIRQALRDQEAEIAKAEGDLAAMSSSYRRACTLAAELRDRAEKAEALLSEAWGFMRDAGLDWDDTASGSLRDRITAHLGAEHE